MGTYYVRLVQHGTNACLGVFGDPNFTQAIAAPVSIQVTSSTYNFLSHGVIAWGSSYRKVNMSVDNMRVCTYSVGCGIRPAINESPTVQDEILNLRPEADVDMSSVQLFPNPSDGTLNFSSQEAVQEIKIYDASSLLIKQIRYEKDKPVTTGEIDAKELENGIYTIEVIGITQKWQKQIVIHK